METLFHIIQRARGFRPTLYVKIENPPYMTLVIEATPEPGPLGLPAISVAHYGEQNGDLMRDPEMCFEMSKDSGGSYTLDPYYWRNDYAGVEERSREWFDGDYFVLFDMYVQHKRFARMWDNNLRLQGFEKAFTDTAILG